MSLIEVMIATAIMAVVGLAFMQMTTGQQRETRALSEKLAILDFQSLMAKVLADGTVCKFDLTDTVVPSNPGNPVRFRDTLPGAAIAPIPLTRIHSGIVAPLPVLAGVGTALTPSLRVSAITIENISRMGPQRYRAELLVGFSGGVRPVKPALASIVLQTDGGAANPGMETVTDCAVGGAGGATCSWEWVSQPPPGGWGSYFGTTICPGNGVLKGLDVVECDRDGSQRDYCFRIYCCN